MPISHNSISRSWVIVGGGVHGVHLAIRLIAEGIVTQQELAIIDPGPSLLYEWRKRVDAVGMVYLRSTVGSHLANARNDLREFSQKQADLSVPPFMQPLERPSVELFDRHCDGLIESYGLSDAHLQDTAVAIERQEPNFTIRCESGATVSAHHVALCTGWRREPQIPSWATPIMGSGLKHIFDEDFTWDDFAETRHLLVIGGGISAAQAAIKAAQYGKQVTILARHGIREHQHEVDSGWDGVEYMRDYLQERDWSKRREIISEARYPGSMPTDVRDALQALIEEKRVVWSVDEVAEVQRIDSGFSVSRASGSPVTADGILLATGFVRGRPGGALVDGLIEHMNLPVANCGFPIVDTSLCWAENLYVMGPLAELELGPGALGILGARRGVMRILCALTEQDFDIDAFA